MIWGVSIQPGEFYSETIKDEVQLSMAALESRNQEEKSTEGSDYNQVIVQTESAEYVLCTLVHGMLFQQYLDMKLMPGEKVKFSVQGKYVVHLTGYSVCVPLDETAQVPQEEYIGGGAPDQSLTEDQGEPSDWIPESLQNIKEEPPEQDDVIEVPDDTSPIQEYEQEYSKPSVRVPPVISPQRQPAELSPQIEKRPLHRTMVQQRRPQMMQRQLQQKSNQRTQLQMQARARRRLMPGQRSHAMQRASMRRVPSSQQRRIQRIVQTSQMRSGPRIQIQPITSQPNLPPSHHSPAQRGGQQEQQIITEAISVPSNRSLQPSTTIPQHVNYPITIEHLSDISGTQVQSLPGSSMLGYPSPLTEIGDGITLSESSVQNMPETSMGNLEGSTIGTYMSNFQQESALMDMRETSSVDIPQMSGGNIMSEVHVPGTSSMPGTSGASLQGAASMGIPGTSQAPGDQMGQQGDMAPHAKDFSKQVTHSSPGGQMSSVYRCHICCASFTDNYSFKLHQRTKHGETGWQRLAASRNLRNSNVRTCVEGKPFQCSYCPKAFKRKYVLQIHERMHSGERPYKCRTCERRFAQSIHRLSHERSVHQELLHLNLVRKESVAHQDFQHIDVKPTSDSSRGSPL